MLKKCIAYFVSLLAVLALNPLTVFAAEETAAKPIPVRTVLIFTWTW